MTTADVRVPSRPRSTRQGAAVDDVLASSDRFLTAQALHDELRRRRRPVGLTTVYRHLHRLAETGTVDVVVSPDGEASYRLCGPSSGGSPDNDSHHHHLVCRTCGRSAEVEGPEVERWAERVAADAGFTDVTHTVEIFGTCDRHRSGPRQVGRQ
jgi:Fur family ferric uptake transcriptional regulator